MTTHKILHSLRFKIALSYVILITLIGAIGCIVFIEKESVKDMEKDVKVIYALRYDIYDIHSRITSLAFSGESVIGWNRSSYEKYHKQRKQLDSILLSVKPQLKGIVSAQKIDTIRYLLATKEKHLYKMRHMLKGEEKTQTVLQNELSQIAHKISKASKKIIVGKREKKPGFFKRLFGKHKNEDEAKIKTIIPRYTQDLYTLNQKVIRQQRRREYELSTYTDSLQKQNAELNNRLESLLSGLDKQAFNVFQKREQALSDARNESYQGISNILIISFIVVLIFGFFIYRDILRRNKDRDTLKMLSDKNEKLLIARKKMMLTVSHDLRAPLASISGYAELIPDERKKEKRIHYCETIRQSSDKMLSFLDTLLSFYRLETGKEQLDNHPFRLKNLADDLEAEYLPITLKKQLDFTVEYDSDDVVVSGDRQRLLQIAGNLLSNAVKFTKAGSITLKLHYEKGLLSIIVTDTGTGITKEEQQKIFKPFEQLENAETEDGFGLGLAITLGLVNLLKGEININSEKNKGCTFTMQIPLPIATEENSKPKESFPCTPPEGIRVAVVDNDTVLLTMTMDMLARYKVRCDGCHNASELMAQMHLHAYDLVITDIKMPDINGFQLLELLRISNIGTSRIVPVLAMTACAERKAEDFIKAGFAGCLYKPFSFADLMISIQSCVDKKKKRSSPMADFSMLLSGEKNGKEMLALLVHETNKDMTTFAESMKKGDLDAIRFLTHHLIPLWEIVQMDAPLKTLRQILPDATNMTDELQAAIQDVTTVGKELVTQAEKLIKKYGDE